MDGTSLAARDEMRWLALSVGVVAACGTTDDGAHLALTAPADLGTVGTIQIVLASADPAYIDPIDQQRSTPTAMTDEAVTYYRQAASGGVIEGPIDDANGYKVRITPNAAEYPADQYIPFVLVYGAGDVGSSKLIAIGTFHADGDPRPLPIKIQANEIDTYTLDVKPVTVPDPNGSIAANQAELVDCQSRTATWHSGLAWQPATGLQIRVLLPDLGADPTAKDAMSRMLDLDCDQHAASNTDVQSDCDDTRASFHEDAADTCDGMDTNCDGAQYWVGTCTPAQGNVCANQATGQGVELCDEATGVDQCVSDPACLCALGPSTTGCVQCTVDHLQLTSSTSLTPCQPGIGVIKAPTLCTDTERCQVQVLAVRGGWDALVATSSATAFGKLATGVQGQLLLKALRPEGPGVAIPGMPGHETGQVDLNVIDSVGNPHYMGVVLENAIDFKTTCPGSGSGSGAPYSMVCSP
jgi:hypothetical protein